MSTKLKPFDLEAALRGEPVVTRDGRPITQITKFDVKNSKYCIAAVVNDDIESFTAKGEYRFESECGYDLFMATKTVKKEGWINIYKGVTGLFEYRAIYTTKKAAEKGRSTDCIATVKIEWEEEV